MTPPQAALRAELPLDLEALNAELRALRAAERVQRTLELLPGRYVLSSSFGAQAAVSLHLVTRVAPGIPVILIDTGHLFPETYRFIDQLTERLALNLKVYRSAISSAWLEARHGKLWEQGREGIESYNRLHKLEPMERAMRELQAGTWFAGLAASSPRVAPRSSRCSLPAPGDSRCIRSTTGRTGTCIATSGNTTCPITRCGSRATSRSATGTRPGRCAMRSTPMRRAFSA
jgi:phosphoadenosine phosphosulfate reductase